MAAKPRVRLIHADATQARARAATLRAAGYAVDARRLEGPDDLRALGQRPPDALVIDLSRAPAFGRDLGLALRGRKATRGVPLVFVAGAEGEVARVRALLPDATFATWRGIRGALRRAREAQSAEPAAPGVLAGYSGTPLPKKLGIGPRSRVALIGAPDDLEATLGPLPEGVRLTRDGRGAAELVLWFVTRRADLERRLERVAQRVTEGGGLWIAWPKKASGVTTDVTQDLVRGTGLAAGLVDYKICAIDATWSGLKFARRRR